MMRYEVFISHAERPAIGGDDGIVYASSNRGRIMVGSSQRGAEAGPKRLAVRQLKRYASWVQNVVRQFGLYPLRALEICGKLATVREDLAGRIPSVPVVGPTGIAG